MKPVIFQAFTGSFNATLRFAAAIVLTSGVIIAGAPAQAAVPVEKALHCLAMNIYHEARGEPEAGKYAVGHVVMNRVSNSRYPDEVCKVVRQGGFKRRYRCQFSWWCDGKSDQPIDRAAWQTSKRIAYLVYAGFSVDPTRGAMWYHADYVSPYWRDAFTRSAKIGQHIFYLDRNKRPARVETTLPLGPITIADLADADVTAVEIGEAPTMLPTVDIGLETSITQDIDAEVRALFESDAHLPITLASMSFFGFHLARRRRAV